MKRIRHRLKTLFGGLNICPANPPRIIHIPHRSVEEALRSDWTRIGGDFRHAIDKLHETGI